MSNTVDHIKHRKTILFSELDDKSIVDKSHVVSLLASTPSYGAYYVTDEVTASDSTGDGSYSKPWRTIEYAIANSVVNMTNTGNTTINNDTITNISDTSNYSIGQIVTGTGIPYQTNILSKTSNSITLTNLCTATNSDVTITIWKPKKLIISGNHLVTSQIEKEGIYPNITAGSTVICNSSIFLIGSLNRNIDIFINIDGNLINKHSGSSLLSNSAGYSYKKLIITGTGKYVGYGTVEQMGFQYNTSVSFYCTLFSFEALNGSIGTLYVTSDGYWNGYKYGLTLGVSLFGGRWEIDGVTQTPSNIYAIRCLSNSGKYLINGNVYGSFYNGSYALFHINGNIYGTTLSLGVTDDGIINGNTYMTTCDIYGRGHFIHNGVATGSWTVDGYTKFNALAGNITANSGKHIITIVNDYNGTCNSISLTNNSIVDILNAPYYSEYGYMQLYVGTTTKLISRGYLRGRFNSDIAGIFENYGEFELIDNQLYGITGTFINKSTAKINMKASGDRYAQDSYSPRIYIKNGGKCYLSGEIDARLLSTYAPIKKDDTSYLEMRGLKLLCHASKNPIYCTSASSGSTDILVMEVETNLNNTSYSIENSSDGGTAPTFIIKRNLTENINIQ